MSTVPKTKARRRTELHHEEARAGRSAALIDLTSTSVRRSARSGFLPHGPESWDAAKLGVDDRC